MPRPRLVLPLALAAVLLAMPAPGVSAEPASKITPGLADQLAALGDGAVHGAFVHFDGGTPAQHRALLDDAGLAVTADFESTAGAVFAVGPVESLRALAAQPSVTRLEEDRLLTLHGDTAVWSTRARVVQENVSGGPFYDAAGRILDGEGVGVAIVDSGINAAHPDLASRVAANFKIVCSTPGLINTTTGMCFGPRVFVDTADVGTTDTSSGHGTHVSGIVAGDGTQSTGPYPVAEAAPNVRGTFTGVAPGARLVGYSTGEAISVLYALEAWQHIFDNYDTFEPRIKLVNNSFGELGGATYDPASIEAKVVKSLVGKGVTMVFSAGNGGGTGSADLTSSYCDDPTPGVICVANYDDGSPGTSPTGTGNRDFALNASSSRGNAADSATWPDVSAPGTFYTAACIRGVQPVCATGIVNEVRWGGFYGSISGTSMASPHVVGIAALLLQARPGLTPAQVEDTIVDTAYKFTAGAAYVPDPQNSGETTSFDKGSGLTDAPAALTALGVASAGLSVAEPQTPTVAITAPADGTVVKPKGTLAVSGTAFDGTPEALAPEEQLILDGDGGDLAAPGAADIVRLAVQETPAGAATAGLTYRLTVRDASDFGAVPSVTLRVTQNVNGKPFQTNVSATPLAVAAAGGSAPATSVTRTGNTVEFFVPFTNLGNPTAGAPAHNVFASTFVQVIVDVAPGAGGAAAADLNVRPMLGRPYTILRPAASPAPAARVTLSVDGGPEQTSELSGSSPSYAWSRTIGLKGLKKGTHTLRATLYLDGAARATDTSTIVVR